MGDVISRLYDINEDLFAVLKEIEDKDSLEGETILFHTDLLESNIEKIKREVFQKNK